MKCCVKFIRLMQRFSLCKINLHSSVKIKLKVFPDFDFFFFIFFLAVYLVHRFKLFRSSKKTLKLSIVQLIQVIKDKNPRKLAVTAANLKIDLLLNKA